MKKAKCFKCNRNLIYHQSFASGGEYVREKRDIDGLDIFSCGYFICHAEFKIDTDYFLKNGNKKNFIYKTIDAKYDYTDGIKKPKKKKLFGIF